MATFEIKMPKLGESITEGTIVSWSVKIGDIINEDDILFEVNTAKVSAEVPSPIAGKVINILFQEGDTVAVGTVVAIVEIEGEDEKNNNEIKQDKTTSNVDKNPQEDKENKTSTEPGKVNKGTEERWYSPVVLEKARTAKINQQELDAINGTGYQGRVSKHDIELYIENKQRGTKTSESEEKPTMQQATVSSSVQSEPQQKQQQTSTIATEDDEVIAMDPIRRIIADRMVASKKISPHVTNVIEVDVSKLVKWREKNKEAFKKREGISLTYLPAVAEATAKALRDYPRVNSSVDGYNIIQKKNINIGIAVSLNDGNLIVPVIKNADKLNIEGLATSIASIANKARANKLMPDDIQGGTFTITNFGSFKSLFGTPIINQPEVAILGVGIIEKKASVVETSEGDVIAIRHKMYLSLSYDHRVIDGSLGGNFLHRIAEYLENWNI